MKYKCSYKLSDQTFTICQRVLIFLNPRLLGGGVGHKNSKTYSAVPKVLLGGFLYFSHVTGAVFTLLKVSGCLIIFQ
jgi:hypothetical protein